MQIDAMVKEMRAAGEPIVNLSAGDPNVPVPDMLIGGLHAVSRQKYSNYTSAQGLLNLRAQIDEDPDRVLIANGAKQLIYMALMATCNPGDKVVIMSPCWSSYFEIATMLGLDIIKMDNVYELDKITNAVSAVLINNPNNPTGCVYGSNFMEELYNKCLEMDCWLISDEIYKDIIYENPEDFISLRGRENVIYIDGLSKTYGITGWRFGYAVADPAIIHQMTLLQSQMSGPPNTIVQEAVLHGWGYIQKPDINIYKERRDFIASLNPRFMNLRPQAGFYFYIPLDHGVKDSTQWCKDTLKYSKIALTPGDEYGRPKTFRLSFASCTMEELQRVAPTLSKLI